MRIPHLPTSWTPAARDDEALYRDDRDSSPAPLRAPLGMTAGRAPFVLAPFAPFGPALFGPALFGPCAVRACDVWPAPFGPCVVPSFRPIPDSRPSPDRPFYRSKMPSGRPHGSTRS